jgi:hypothetical protein
MGCTLSVRMGKNLKNYRQYELIQVLILYLHTEVTAKH